MAGEEPLESGKRPIEHDTGLTVPLPDKSDLQALASRENELKSQRQGMRRPKAQARSASGKVHEHAPTQDRAIQNSDRALSGRMARNASALCYDRGTVHSPTLPRPVSLAPAP